LTLPIVVPPAGFYPTGPYDSFPLSQTSSVSAKLLLLSLEVEEHRGLALEKLMPLMYNELCRLARRYMSRVRTDHTLQTTALVNEAYLRLVDASKVRWQNRAHFLAYRPK